MKHLVFYMALVLTLVFAGSAHAGNGAPSGAHYNLNIICVPNGKKADMTGTQGHTIFVSCSGKSTINLIEGSDFGVLDRNGTDGPASFRLPPADTGVISDTAGSECTLNADGISYTCGTGISVYSVFARALGNPNGTAVMMLCGLEDPLDPSSSVCGTDNQLILDASGRPAKFENVTANLLYLYNVTINGVLYKRVPLFSDVLQGYFWDYTNTGLKLLQLRFYHCETVVPADWPGDIDSACLAK
jgi:hypothetical protein